MDMITTDEGRRENEIRITVRQSVFPLAFVLLKFCIVMHSMHAFTHLYNSSHR